MASTSARTKDPALDKLAADWAAAFAKGDAKALAGFYTDNAVRVTDGGAVVGRAAIEKEFAANFAGPWKGSCSPSHPRPVVLPAGGPPKRRVPAGSTSAVEAGRQGRGAARSVHSACESRRSSPPDSR